VREKIKECLLCHGKGYYWRQPLPLYVLPGGNYGLLGNEIKTNCPLCNKESELIIKEKEYENI